MSIPSDRNVLIEGDTFCITIKKALYHGKWWRRGEIVDFGPLLIYMILLNKQTNEKKRNKKRKKKRRNNKHSSRLDYQSA